MTREKAEEYKPVKIPFRYIKRMIKNGTWKGSLEEEELLYNLEHNFYSKSYAKLVREIIKE